MWIIPVTGPRSCSATPSGVDICQHPCWHVYHANDQVSLVLIRTVFPDIPHTPRSEPRPPSSDYVQWNAAIYSWKSKIRTPHFSGRQCPRLTKGWRRQHRLQHSQAQLKWNSKWINARWTFFFFFCKCHTCLCYYSFWDRRITNDFLGHWQGRKLNGKKEEKNKRGLGALLPLLPRMKGSR